MRMGDLNLERRDYTHLQNLRNISEQPEGNLYSFRNMGRKQLERILLVLAVLGIDGQGKHEISEDVKEKLSANNYRFIQDFEFSQILNCTRKGHTFCWYLNRCDYEKESFTLEFKTFLLKSDYELSDISFECKITSKSEQYGLYETGGSWLEISHNNAQRLLTAISECDSSLREFNESFLSSVKMRYKLFDANTNIKLSDIKNDLKDIIMCQQNWRRCSREEYPLYFQNISYNHEIEKYDNHQGFAILIVSRMTHRYKSRLLNSVENILILLWKNNELSLPIEADYNKTLKFNRNLLVQRKNISYQQIVDSLKKETSKHISAQKTSIALLDFANKFKLLEN